MNAKPRQNDAERPPEVWKLGLRTAHTAAPDTTADGAGADVVAAVVVVAVDEDDQLWRSRILGPVLQILGSTTSVLYVVMNPVRVPGFVRASM